MKKTCRNLVLVASAGLAMSAGVQVNEGFESTPTGTLPTGWTEGTIAAGLLIPWAVVATGGNGASTNAVFTNDVSTRSDRWLQLPTIVSQGQVTVDFYSNYSTETGFDGWILEASVNGGAYTNVGDAAWVLGGYNSTISLNFNSPILGQRAFTGAHATWEQHTAQVLGAVGDQVSLRFRMATDTSVASTGVKLDDIVTSTSAGPPTGACCFAATLTCQILTPAVCAGQSGVYSGDNTTCAASCASPGACCMNDGSCAQVLPAACATANGIYAGDSILCANANCAPGGACCRTDGSCATLTSAACTAAGGVFTAGNTCATSICPGGYGFSKTIPGTFTDISATGNALGTGDDASFAFTSSVTNALVTNPSLFACTNGFISDVANTVFTNTTLPRTVTGLTFALCPNWDDLFVDPALTPPSSLREQGLVEGGIPVHIIQWDMVRTYFAQTPVAQGSFQVKIWGAGGPALVQYIYQGMAWDFNGNSSTVGVQWTATAAAQRSYSDTNAPGTPPGQIPDNSTLSVVGFTAPSACYPNCDLSTTTPCLNVLDFSCFLNKFAAQDTYANCDNSTQPPVLNVLDFSCFLNSFAAGCSSC